MDKEKLKKNIKEEYEAEFTYLNSYKFRILYPSKSKELFEWFWHHLEKLQKENESINYELGELLAILHGDGGHYQEKHGTLKAIIDAKELSNKEWIRPMEDKNLDEL